MRNTARAPLTPPTARLLAAVLLAALACPAACLAWWGGDIVAIEITGDNDDSVYVLLGGLNIAAATGLALFAWRSVRRLRPAGWLTRGRFVGSIVPLAALAGGGARVSRALAGGASGLSLLGNAAPCLVGLALATGVGLLIRAASRPVAARGE